MNDTKRCCAFCANFAGRSRDRDATLFRSNRGYCDAAGHPGGRWNVLQDITGECNCERFCPVLDDMKRARERALIHYGLRNKEEAHGQR